MLINNHWSKEQRQTTNVWYCAAFFQRKKFICVGKKLLTKADVVCLPTQQWLQKKPEFEIDSNMWESVCQQQEEKCTINFPMQKVLDYMQRVAFSHSFRI